MINEEKPEVKDVVFVATANRTAGTACIEGGRFLIPVNDVANGATGVGYFRGSYGLVKASGTTALAAATAYFDSSSGLVEASDSATNRKIGAFQEAAVNGATTCVVALDGVSFGAGNEDLEDKADKVTGAVNGNFAGLNAAGNLTDSGVAPADKMDVVSGATAGHLVAQDASGNAADTNVSVGDDLIAVPGDADSESLSIASGVITPTGAARVLNVSPETTAADDLDTIEVTNLPGDGSKLFVFNDDATYAITLKDATGNLDLAPGDTVLNAGDSCSLVYDGTNWVIDVAATSTVTTRDALLAAVEPESLAAVDNSAGITFMLRVPLGAATPVSIYSSDAPFGFEVIAMQVLATATVGSGSAKLTDGTHDITDAVACATDGNLAWAATIDDAYSSVAEGGSLAITKNAAGDTGIAYITCLRV